MSSCSRRRSHAVSALRRTAPRRPAAAPRRPAPCRPSGRRPPGTPAARRSPHRSSAAGHPRFRVLRPGWRRAGRERRVFPGAARPWVRDDGRSASPALSSPAPARPATADGGPGLRGNGKRRRGRTGGGAWSGGRPGPAGGEVRQDQGRDPGRWPTALSRPPLAGGAGWPPARDRRHQPAPLPARSSPPRPRRGRA